MVEVGPARAVGFNHVALEVGDIEEALAFYGRLFDFELRGKSETSAFIDLGDQFLALQKGRTQPADDGRHFGLVVDDKDAVRKALADAGIETAARSVSRLSRSVGQPHRDRRLRQHPVHQGAERAARHGAGASVEEREGDQGAHGQGHGAELSPQGGAETRPHAKRAPKNTVNMAGTCGSPRHLSIMSRGAISEANRHHSPRNVQEQDIKKSLSDASAYFGALVAARISSRKHLLECAFTSCSALRMPTVALPLNRQRI